ncbi:MAG TPA: sigma-E factor regulatory protein RseB domain-containing protein [Planctomycetota bacterium]|nr:sigma-E factor regulatory protein RseB domain-containing protein [Planctomycetota bacterium]
MNRKVAGIVVASVLCTGAIATGVLAAARTSRLEALLARIEAAEDGVPYDGVREMGGGPETVRLRIQSQGGRKKVEFLSIRGGARPAAKRPPGVPFFGGIPMFLRPGEGQWKRKIKDFELAVRNYDVAVTGRETVAGREADVVELRARHAGRPSYRIAADVENRFPLGFQVLDGTAPVFEARFQSIAFNPKFAEKAFDEPAPRPGWIRADREESPLGELSARAGYGVWLPSSLPRGFEVRGAEIFRVRVEVPEGARQAMKAFLPVGLPKLDVPIVHVNYTDGLAVLSVVECPADSELWKFLKKFVPAEVPRKNDGKVVARKFADRRGAAYLLELEGTVVLAAGNVSAEEIEKIIPTFERR